MKTVTTRTLRDWIDRAVAPPIVDVRTPAEFAAGHVPGAVNLPLTDLMLGRAVLSHADDPRANGRDGAPRVNALVVYCGHGPRAWMASRALKRLGAREITYLKGHWAAWRRAGLPVERA